MGLVRQVVQCRQIEPDFGRANISDGDRGEWSVCADNEARGVGEGTELVGRGHVGDRCDRTAGVDSVGKGMKGTRQRDAEANEVVHSQGVHAPAEDAMGLGIGNVRLKETSGVISEEVGAFLNVGLARARGGVIHDTRAVIAERVGGLAGHEGGERSGGVTHPAARVPGFNTTTTKRLQRDAGSKRSGSPESWGPLDGIDLML